MYINKYSGVISAKKNSGSNLRFADLSTIDKKFFL